MCNIHYTGHKKSSPPHTVYMSKLHSTSNQQHIVNKYWFQEANKFDKDKSKVNKLLWLNLRELGKNFEYTLYRM